MNLFTHARLCKILSIFFALSNAPSYAFVSTNPQTHSNRSNLPQSLNMQSEKQPAHSVAFTRRELFKKSTILFPLLVPQLALASDCIGGCVRDCMREITHPEFITCDENCKSYCNEEDVQSMYVYIG